MDTTPRLDGSIAVVGQWRKGYGRLPVPYLHAVEIAGGRGHVLTPFDLLPGEDIPPGLDVRTGIDPDDTSALDDASGLLIPGGGDIDPIFYGMPRHPRTHNVSHRRDRFELNLLHAALERDMPILAICHGMQLLNVYLGGTLDQHLADVPERLDHDRDRPRAEPVHEITVQEGTSLAEAMGVRGPVNSHHHQGLATVPERLQRIAWSEDGVLEAVVARGYSWVLGVQWHPEAMADTDSGQRRIFESFVDAAVRFEHRQDARQHARSA